MRQVPELQQLARRMPGDPSGALHRLLVVLCELLGMELAAVATVTGEGHVAVQVAVNVDGTAAAGRVDGLGPLVMDCCRRVLVEDLLLVADVTSMRGLVPATASGADAVGSFAGVALRDDKGAFGALYAVSRRPQPSLNSRDGDVLRGLGAVVGPLLRVLQGAIPVRLPLPREAPDLSAVADAVAAAQDVEQLSRPLLDALHDLTGLASSYLTVIHEERDVQEIRFARNTRDGFEIREGLVVPWADTLCKRALDEGRPFNSDVAVTWGDSQAAADLGIQSYVSVPVSLSDGRIWGTLCAADDQQATQIDEHLPTMRLFAKLIAAQVEQEAAIEHERGRAALARAEADLDPLTRCATRRVVEPWLTETLASLASHEAVLAVYVDVDRFKEVNDTWGHAAGDAVLAEVGLLLHGLAQPGDLVARLGGDEFLVAARLPRHFARDVADRYLSARSLSVPWSDQVLSASISIGTAVSDGVDAAKLLAAADTAMYADKRTERGVT